MPNTEGRLIQTTDPGGTVATYLYDVTGQHLISVVTNREILRYTYVTGQGIAQEHALESITYPDSTHTFFTYDSQGRLSEEAEDNGFNPVMFTYLSPGGYSVTDSTQGDDDHPGQ